MRTGGDIYSYFGEYIYGFVISKKTHPLERQIAKSGVLGLCFGMAEDRFIDYCKQNGISNMDRDEAIRIKNIYRSMFTGVVECWKYMQKVVLPALMDKQRVSFPSKEHELCYTALGPLLKEPVFVLPGGLQLRYPGIERDEHGTWSYMSGATRTKTFGGSMLENVAQAVAGRILREAIYKIRKAAHVDDIRIVTNTHDELLCVINDTDELREYRRAVDAGEKVKPPRTPESDLVERIMTETPAYLPGIPLAIEYDYGYRYGDAK
jgi:hypothetical protein